MLGNLCGYAGLPHTMHAVGVMHVDAGAPEPRQPSTHHAAAEPLTGPISRGIMKMPDAVPRACSNKHMTAEQRVRTGRARLLHQAASAHVVAFDTPLGRGARGSRTKLHWPRSRSLTFPWLLTQPLTPLWWLTRPVQLTSGGKMSAMTPLPVVMNAATAAAQHGIAHHRSGCSMSAPIVRIRTAALGKYQHTTTACMVATRAPLLPICPTTARLLLQAAPGQKLAHCGGLRLSKCTT